MTAHAASPLSPTQKYVYAPALNGVSALENPPLAMADIGDARVGQPVPVSFFTCERDAQEDYAIRASALDRRVRVEVAQYELGDAALRFAPRAAASDLQCLQLESIRDLGRTATIVGVVEPSPFGDGQRLVVLQAATFAALAAYVGLLRPEVLIPSRVDPAGL